ncbi:MAG: aerotolerance regulator BatA [Candidatus Marinimicrobia bacterium]|nr:aerotolerance regulator BatA [Candidatus Neomarinimicrobiota bacterium]|tara:strand:- start:3561 stop:4553 length:993 start_codon:yes stop_codon:yes gene_type:complete
MFEFANPWFLLFSLLIPLALWWQKRWGEKHEGTIQISTIESVKHVSGLSGNRKVQGLRFVKFAVLALLIMAMARPRAVLDLTETSMNVVDINLVLDISSSMRAEDFKPNRLEAAKATARKFIEDREGDRIGLLVFAGESYIQCPLTIDYEVLLDLLDQVGIVDEANDGTAIGMAIAHGINRLRGSETKNRIMVLLSDGSNNAGELDPITSASFAKEYDIRIYAIGVGTRGKAPFPVDDPVIGKRYVQVPVEMDEQTLQQVAETTGGKYFRATDEERLGEIYEEINDLERSEISVKQFREYRELFGWLLIPSVALMIGVIFINQNIFRKRA